MRFYNRPHRFYAGGDLHARTLYLHILDDQGNSRFEANLPANPETFPIRWRRTNKARHGFNSSTFFPDQGVTAYVAFINERFDGSQFGNLSNGNYIDRTMVNTHLDGGRCAHGPSLDPHRLRRRDRLGAHDRRRRPPAPRRQVHRGVDPDRRDSAGSWRTLSVD